MSRAPFASTAELTEWMQEEYLSELLLRSMKPKPKIEPPSEVVCFAWGLAGVEENALQMYSVRASGVTRWTLDGQWDKTMPVSFVANTAADAPVVLHQAVPGLLALECAQVSVERGPMKRYRPTPRPDANRFLVRGQRELCWRELVAWMGPPADVRVFEQLPGERGNRQLDDPELDAVVKSPCFGTFRLQRRASDEQPWLWVSWALAITTSGHYADFRRGALDDEAWRRVRQIPSNLGSCTVNSGSIQCEGEEWVARFAR